MNWLYERTLATKLGLAFTAVLLLTAAVGAFSITQLAQVNSTAGALSERWMPSMRVVQDLKSQIARVRTREFQYIISSEAAEMDKYDKVIANDLVDLAKMQTEYVALLQDAVDKAL
ncbi:MAG: MCP four helix bundle domain-containing protein [Sphingomonadaceae bacterium]